MMTLNDFTLVQKFPLDLPPNKYKDSIEINVDDPILEPLIESNEKVSTNTINENCFSKRLIPTGLPVDTNITKNIEEFNMELLLANIQQHGLKDINDLNRELIGTNQESPMYLLTLTMSDEHMSRGKLIFKPKVKKLTSNEISFVDGTVLTNINVLIFGSVYEIDYQGLEKLILKMKDGRLFCYKHMFLQELMGKNLAVIGCIYRSEGTLQEDQHHLMSWMFKGILKFPRRDVNEVEATLATQHIFNWISCQGHMMLPDVHFELLIDSRAQFRSFLAARQARVKSVIHDQRNPTPSSTDTPRKNKLLAWTKDFLLIFVMIFVIFQILLLIFYLPK